MLITLRVELVSQLFANVETHQVVYIKYEQVVVYLLYFNRTLKKRKEMPFFCDPGLHIYN